MKAGLTWAARVGGRKAFSQGVNSSLWHRNTSAIGRAITAAIYTDPRFLGFADGRPFDEMANTVLEALDRTAENPFYIPTIPGERLTTPLLASRTIALNGAHILNEAHACRAYNRWEADAHTFEYATRAAHLKTAFPGFVEELRRKVAAKPSPQADDAIRALRLSHPEVIASLLALLHEDTTPLLDYVTQGTSPDTSLEALRDELLEGAENTQEPERIVEEQITQLMSRFASGETTKAQSPSPVQATQNITNLAVFLAFCGVCRETETELAIKEALYPEGVEGALAGLDCYNYLSSVFPINLVKSISDVAGADQNFHGFEHPFPAFFSACRSTVHSSLEVPMSVIGGDYDPSRKAIRTNRIQLIETFNSIGQRIGEQMAPNSSPARVEDGKKYFRDLVEARQSTRELFTQSFAETINPAKVAPSTQR
jgi:hypothetical protein